VPGSRRNHILVPLQSTQHDRQTTYVCPPSLHRALANLREPAPNLKNLFAPRPPLRYLPPHDVPLEERRTARITGVAQFVPMLKEKAENAEASNRGQLQPGDEGFEPPPTESKLEAADRRKLEQAAQTKWLTTEGFKQDFDPKSDPTVRGDAFRTIFIARLNYDVTVDDLQHAFQRYGSIERIRVVAENGGTEERMRQNGVNLKKISKKKRKGASKGYAFIVFTNENDMKGMLVLFG
jgi:U1 small nuclear ribonucleoprotein 70kDa